jgi:cleavage and polyadenylation specificity factor subunit 3
MEVITEENEVKNRKRKATIDIPVGETDVLEIMPLGAGNEVGRSCLLMTFKGKTIMLDCGIHPAHSGISALPYFDFIEDPSKIDLLLVSHFHLDHAASLPYFLEKVDFRGRVFMTHPTKAIYKMLLTDYIRVSNLGIEDSMLFDEQDLERSMNKIEPINFHQELEHAGIKFWCYNAGHVLGAAMFMIEIAGVKVLYTGDFSRQEDRHLMAAEIPELCPDVLIVESTYGIQVHEPRKDREARFTNIIHNIVIRGGRCLIPVFALGRAQELLLILDEYWNTHEDLKNIPIYYASTLGKKCMAVYQTYTSMMNEKIRNSVTNPFHFENIQDLTSIDNFQDNGPCVVMASPGMLQSGLSRQLFELWSHSKKNGVMIPGYCVEGTLAKTIMNASVDTYETLEGRKAPLNLAVHYISFSAHSDFIGTSTFIDSLSPPNVILVHGEKSEMQRLQQSLIHKYSTTTKKIEIATPRNCQTVKIQFREQKMAKAVGRIASGGVEHLAKISGVLVHKDFQYMLVDPTDLNNFTKLQTSVISQTQRIPFSANWASLVYQIKEMYEQVENTTFDDKICVKVHNLVYVILTSEVEVTLDWKSSPVDDMVADSLAAIVLHIDQNPAAFQNVPETKDPIQVEEDKFFQAEKLLTSFYGNVGVDRENRTMTVTFDESTALYHFDKQIIESDDDGFKKTLEDVLGLFESVFPIARNEK